MAKSPDAFRTISEVSEWLDTKPHVLRFWESKFKEISPVKRAGGRRYYRPDDMRLIGGIKKLLHDDGMTIKGVQKMLAAQGVDDVAALSQPLDFSAGAGDNATVRAVASDDSVPDSRASDTASTDTLPPSTSDDEMVQDQTAAEAGDADTLVGDVTSDGAVPKDDQVEDNQVEDDQVAAEMDDTADDAPAAAPTSDDVPSDGLTGPDAAPTADSEDAAQEIVADESDAIPDDATPDAAPESTVVQLDTGAEDDDLGEEPLLFPEIGDEEFWEDAAAADSEDKVIHLTPRVTQIDRPAAEPSVFAPLPAQRPAAPVATLYTMTPDQRAALAADHQTAIVGLIQWAQRRVAGA